MASTYLTKTFGSSGSQQTATFSVWVKRTKLGGSGYSLFGYAVDASNFLRIGFKSSDELAFRNYNGGTYTWQLETNRVFRDTSAWYHIVFEVDSTQATSSDRLKLYVNGVQETSFSTATYPSQNANMKWGNNAYAHIIGDATGGEKFDGVMTHINVIDGTAYDASTFGETDATTGIWKPKTAPSVTYGTNGFFLKFASAGSLGTDSSGNGNNFTLNGSGTQTQDTPANVFSTWNPLSYNSANGNWALGATEFNTGASAYRSTFSSLAANKGKYYMEIKAIGSDTAWSMGVLSIDMKSETDNISYIGDSNCGTRAVGYLGSGNTTINGSETSGFSSFTTNDIIMIALDLDNGKVYFGKNGTWGNSGDPTSGATGTGARSITVSTNEYWGFGASVFANTVYGNFGNGYFGTTAVSSANSDANGFGLFEYEVPSGYYALCTKNINSQEYS